jgi:hypothetical protein
MNGPYPEITNISSLAKLFFKTFISLKHLSDYRTVGLSGCRTIGLSDYSYGPETGQHMPLICVYRSQVFKQIMQYCQVIHILSNRIDPGSKHYN